MLFEEPQAIAADEEIYATPPEVVPGIIPMMGDPDVGVDDAVLANYAFLPISEVLQQDPEQWEEAGESAAKEVIKLGQEKARLARHKKDTCKIDKDMKSLQIYRDRLRNFLSIKS